MRLRELGSELSPVTEVSSFPVPSGKLVSTLGSGTLVSGTGMVMVSVGIVVASVVGSVVGAVVGAFVVGGVVAGAVFMQPHAHKEIAKMTLIMKTVIFFICFLLIFRLQR